MLQRKLQFFREKNSRIIVINMVFPLFILFWLFGSFSSIFIGFMGFPSRVLIVWLQFKMRLMHDYSTTASLDRARLEGRGKEIIAVKQKFRLILFYGNYLSVPIVIGYFFLYIKLSEKISKCIRLFYHTRKLQFILFFILCLEKKFIKRMFDLLAKNL